MSVQLTDLPTSVQKNIDLLIEERTFSFSRLSIIEECLYLYYLKYVEQVPVDDETLPLALGKAVHKAIEEKLKGADDKQALLSGWKEVEYYPFDLVEYETLFRNSNVKKGEALNGDVQTEIHFKLPLDEKSDSPYIQGYIDYLRNVFNMYDFQDWKTNRIMYEPTDTFQLPLYAWSISKLYNVESVSGALYFLRFYRDRRKSKVFMKDDMENARQWALSLANKALNSLKSFKMGKPLEEAFPPTLNKRCMYCPFAYICLSTYESIEK